MGVRRGDTRLVFFQLPRLHVLPACLPPNSVSRRKVAPVLGGGAWGHAHNVVQKHRKQFAAFALTAIRRSQEIFVKTDRSPLLPSSDRWLRHSGSLLRSPLLFPRCQIAPNPNLKTPHARHESCIVSLFMRPVSLY